MMCDVTIMIAAVLTISMLMVFKANADEFMQCGRTARYLHELPCDLKENSWCVTPGHVYPWDQLKRFMKDNGALMRRMYGEYKEEDIYKVELPDTLVHSRSSRHRMMNLNHLPKASVRKAEPDPIILSTSKYKSSSTTQPTTTTDEMPGLTQMEWSEDAVEVMYTTTADMMTYTTQTEEIKSETPTTTSKPPTTLSDETELPPIRGVNACPVREEVLSPYWANNTRGEVLALLNVYPFEQYVHWEMCTYQHKQMFCRDGCRCEQQYRLHRMLAFDPTNECRGIFSDWFKFPSCCVCKCYDLPRSLYNARSGKMMPEEEETTSSKEYQPISDNDTLDPTPKVKPQLQSLKDLAFDVKWEDPFPQSVPSSNHNNPVTDSNDQLTTPNPKPSFQATTPTIEELSQSPNPAAQEPPQSPHPTVQEPSLSPYPTAQEPSLSPYPTAQEPSLSPYPTAQEPSLSPYPTAQEPSLSPYPTIQEPLQLPYPTVQEPSQPRPASEQPKYDSLNLSTHNMERNYEGQPEAANLSTHNLNAGPRDNVGYTAYSDPTNPEFIARRNYEYQPPVRDPRKLMQRPTTFSFVHRLLRGNVTVQIPYSKIHIQNLP